MSTNLRLVTDEQWPVLERLWQLYRHDLSEFRGTHPDDEGLFQAGILLSYIDDPGRRAYFIDSAAGLAGFVLVRGVLAESYSIGGFFVVRAARRLGVGRDAAIQAMRRHPGRWEIAFQEENPGAARFWRGIAATIAPDSYEEERRPVPGKPHLPPDVWIMLTSPGPLQS